jgi:GNAT superfamily N-acetyltransferase
LNVVSADGNYIQERANKNQFFSSGGARYARNRYFPLLQEAGLGHFDSDTPYIAFELSVINMKAAWAGCNATMRYAHEGDLQQVKAIANQYSGELGYVMWPKLREAVAKRELYVAEYGAEQRIVGFCNWHRRRDDIHTIYEIAVHRDFMGQRIGKALLNAVPNPKRLKCTVDNPANQFYEANGLQLAGTEQGKKRMLNVWQTSKI